MIKIVSYLGSGWIISRHYNDSYPIVVIMLSILYPVQLSFPHFFDTGGW